MKLFVFTMYFNGGMIPTYMLIKDVGLLNSPLVMIIYGAVNVYNLIITRTFFETSIPDGLLTLPVFWNDCVAPFQGSYSSYHALLPCGPLERFLQRPAVYQQ